MGPVSPPSPRSLQLLVRPCDLQCEVTQSATDDRSGAVGQSSPDWLSASPGG